MKILWCGSDIYIKPICLAYSGTECNTFGEHKYVGKLKSRDKLFKFGVGGQKIIAVNILIVATNSFSVQNYQIRSNVLPIDVILASYRKSAVFIMIMAPKHGH